MFRQVLIIGVGLLGSSLALALKKHELATKIVGCSRSQETIRQALKLEIIEGGSTELTDFVSDSDLVVFAMPLGRYDEVARRISKSLKSNAIITDVGSVKQIVVDNVLPRLSPKQRSLFVPGHPIAGSEESGPEAGNAELFAGKQVILTPVEQTNKAMCSKIEEMWRQIGARVDYMPPEKHDEIYAHISHAVQFIAYAYRLAFPGQSKNPDADFQRFFRIAKSNASMWHDIFTTNKVFLLESLRDFRMHFINLMESSIDGQTPLPKLLAKASIEMAGEYKNYAGTGFKDFTSASYSDIKCDQALVDIPSFIAMFDSMVSALKNDKLSSYLPSN